MKAKHYILAKPDRPNWDVAVQRAAKLISDSPGENPSLVHTCQNVPLRYLPQLRADAERLLALA